MASIVGRSRRSIATGRARWPARLDGGGRALEAALDRRGSPGRRARSPAPSGRRLRAPCAPRWRRRSLRRRARAQWRDRCRGSPPVTRAMGAAMSADTTGARTRSSRGRTRAPGAPPHPQPAREAQRHQQRAARASSRRARTRPTATRRRRHRHPRRGPVLLVGLRPQARACRRASRSTRAAATAHGHATSPTAGRSIWDLAKPVIAQVHGYAMAGGTELVAGMRPRVRRRGRADSATRWCAC